MHQKRSVITWNSCYKVEFKAGGMEYEYKIDARTGGVLTYEMDRD